MNIVRSIAKQDRMGICKGHIQSSACPFLSYPYEVGPFSVVIPVGARVQIEIPREVENVELDSGNILKIAG